MNQEYYDRVEKAKAEIIASIAKEYEIHEEEIAIRNNYGNVFSTFNTPTAMKANTAKSERQKAINEILNIGNSSTNSNDALSYALFGKEAKDITPEILDQIRAYAQFLNSKKDN